MLLAAAIAMALATSTIPNPALAEDVVELPSVVHVLEIKYFPLTPDGKNIDRTEVVETGDDLVTVQGRVNAMSDELSKALAAGTRYRGYAHGTTRPFLNFARVASVEFHTKVPVVARTGPCWSEERPGQCSWKADYAGILQSIDICRYVAEKHIDEVWIWAYHMFFAWDAESVMSGPNGDISNSWRDSKLPGCGRTYRLYHYNFNRDTGTMLENHGHQIEAELDYLSLKEMGTTDLFRKEFEGSAYGGPFPFVTKTTHGCGTVHNAPNARWEYDRTNSAFVQSDCEHWSPDGSGPLTSVNCATWTGCDLGTGDHDGRDWIVWWMQNLPGEDNALRYQGKWISNWWAIYADFDAAVASRSAVLTDVEPDQRSAALETFTIGGVDALAADGEISAKAGTTALEVSAVPVSAAARVTVTKPLTVSAGRNEVSVKVTSADGRFIREYRATVTIEPPAAGPATGSSGAAKRITIRCVKGKLIKRITAVKPRCPSGYRRR